MSEVIAHQINFHSNILIQTHPTILVRNKSPQHQKQSLIEKIQSLIQTNDRLEAKQELVQNTIYDIRKLINLTKKEGEEAVQLLHCEVQKLQKEKSSIQAALKYAQRDGNHLQRCSLFWNQFL